MIRIRMKKIGKEEDITRDIKKRWNTFKKHFLLAGIRTRNYLGGFVIASRTRSEGEHLTTESLGDLLLEEAVSEFIETKYRVSFGIANIDILNARAKHWYWQNYGIAQTGTTIPAKGKFVPGYWIGDKFIYADHSGTGMIPKNPIKPMNYIENTNLEFEKQIQKAIGKLRK